MFLFKSILLSQNLIRNGSFENFSAPITWNNFGGEFVSYSQTPTHRVLFDWDEFNSADFLPSVCTQTYFGAPVNEYGQCYAKEGNNYVGFEPVYNNNETKEYIYQQLTSPLQAGKIYCLSFFVSRADRISYAIKSIGAYFSNNIQNAASTGYINAVPQVVNQNGFITDTTQWTEIQGCFTAIGGEQYITIGNFNSNANTDTLNVGTNNPMYGIPNPDIAYYYIDDVTLVDQTTVGLNELNINALSVYPNPTKDKITIKINAVETEHFNMRLTDVLGNEVFTFPPLEGAGGGNITQTINISFLEDGIYFLQLYKNDQLLITKKVIKQ